MNVADIQTGNPKIEGRYLAFVRCQAVQAKDWIEPIVMTWAGGRWHTAFLKNKILGWIGPIPPMKVEHIFADGEAVLSPQEYDL